MAALEDWIHGHDYMGRRGTQDFKIGHRILDGWPGSALSELVCQPKRTRAVAVVSGTTAVLALVSPLFKAYGTTNWARFFLHHHSNKATSFHSPLATEVVLNELATVVHLASPLGLTCGDSKGSLATKRPWVAAAAPPLSHRLLPTPSSRTWVRRVLGLRVLQVEIRVNGVPFYSGFLPKLWSARAPFHFIHKRIQVCANRRSNLKGGRSTLPPEKSSL
jgi:hypothetical protein